MSRIHEALKKAAEERAKHSGNITPDFGDFSHESLAGSAASPTDLPSGGLDSPASRVLFAGLSVQEFMARCLHPAWNIEPNLSVFSEGSESNQGAERFRTLRSRLLQISADPPLQRILVTSSLPEEGKTFVAANLAQSFVQAHRRVLMIDADIRASRLHIHFGVPSGPGLSEYLNGEADEAQVLQVGPEGNLCLIAGGRQVSNASELLHSERMKQLFDRMSEMFNYIIVDSPPALAVYDAGIIADYCDGVLFVLRAGHTDYEIAERASIEFRKKNLLGVVLNRADASDTYGGYCEHYYAKPASGSGKHKRT